MKRDGSREILTPRPDSREGLYYFLHECAHFHLRHNYRPFKPRWQEEYEAEMWAIATMRREGIAVPRRMLTEAKVYVRWCIRKSLEKGQKAPLRVRRWAGFKRKV